VITPAEQERRLNNLAQIGTISEVYTTQRPKDHDDYALFAKVDIMGRTTDFFPILTQHSSFKKHYCPPQVGEQVQVIAPFGNANVGFILRGVVPNDEEPITHSIKDRKTEYIEYEDGTKIEISLHDKKIKLNTPMDIEIKTAKTLVIDAKNITLDKAGNLKIKGQITDELGNLTLHHHDVVQHKVAKHRT